MSRDEVIKLLKLIKSTVYLGNRKFLDALEFAISYLRQPERIRGRWIKMSDADGTYYCCSECGEELYRLWAFDREFDLVPHKESIPKTSYCPNCGADMREGTP